MTWLEATLATAGSWALVNAPAYLSGPHEWKVFWTFNADRGADLGSVWLLLDQMTSHTASVHTINVVSWAFFADLVRRRAVLGRSPPSTPRLAQLGFLLVVGFLLVNKVYSPQYVLWLLPLAVMARPRWRDQLIWQAGELFYFVVGLVVPRGLPEPRRRRRPRLLLGRDDRADGRQALPGRDRGPRRPPAGARRRAHAGVAATAYAIPAGSDPLERDVMSAR